MYIYYNKITSRDHEKRIHEEQDETQETEKKYRVKLKIIRDAPIICLQNRVFGLFGPRSPPLLSGPRPPAPGSHKSFNKLNLFLVKVQSLWSCAHYFQWFTVYLNHVDLLMSHVHVFKETTPLINVHLRFFVDFILCPTDKYMFKVNNKKIRLICWMCSKLKINTAWHRSGVFIVVFDHSSISI